MVTERRVFEQELLYGEARATVVAALRSLRLTQRALAARLGVTEGRVSQVLSGRENITLRTLADVGWALGLRFELNPLALPESVATRRHIRNPRRMNQLPASSWLRLTGPIRCRTGTECKTGRLRHKWRITPFPKPCVAGSIPAGGTI
jgi:DNA-binding transcriptional regulator YdaS (Cro superfamily)